MPEHPLCAVTRSTRVIEHFADLGAETGQDRGLEESVKTGKDDTTTTPMMIFTPVSI
mgnify:CR=1 FL=1